MSESQYVYLTLRAKASPHFGNRLPREGHPLLGFRAGTEVGSLVRIAAALASLAEADLAQSWQARCC